MSSFPSACRTIGSPFLLLVSAMTVAPLTVSSQVEPDVRVLFLGNSSYGSATRGGTLAPFVGYCSAAGVSCEALSNYEVFGPSRSARVDNLWSDLAEDQRLADLLAHESFDYVVLWTHTYGLDDSLWASTVDGLRDLVPRIAASGAATVLATPYDTVGQMDRLDYVEERFLQLEREATDVRVNGVRPTVVHVPLSRFWKDGAAHFGEDAWYAGPRHGSALAQYATGCLWFTFLLGEDPRGLAFNRLPGLSQWEVVSKEAVDWIQRRVWELYNEPH